MPTGAPCPAGRPQGVIATSANAVPALMSIREELRTLPVFAVGRRTAELSAGAGFGQVFSADGDAEALAALVTRTLPPGARLLHIAGRDRRPEPARFLRASGYEILVWESYVALPVRALPDPIAEALRAGTLDGAIHYSGRSASVLIGLVAKAGLAGPLAALPHACLSGEVAAALDPIGPVVVELAGRPDEDNLFAALERAALRARTGPGSRLPQSG